MYHVEWKMMHYVPVKIFFVSEGNTINFLGFNRSSSIEFEWWV